MRKSVTLQELPNFNELGSYANPAFAVSTEDVPRNFQNSNNDDTPMSKSTSGMASFAGKIRSYTKNLCSRKTLAKRLPISSWAPRYNLEDATGDLIAGITVGLAGIPQGLAYASIAGLPPEYGLYGSFLGCFVYILLGSSKDVSMGPTAIVSLVTFQCIKDLDVEHAILLCFLSGAIEILMGLFGLGFIIDFVSGPVSSGFTSACAFLITTSQIKDILGISVASSTFLEMWIRIFERIEHAKLWDTVLGIACIVFLLVLRRIGSIKIGGETRGRREIVINKIFWLIGTTRNAAIVVLCGLLGYACFDGQEAPFKLVGEVPEGMPEFKPPPFGYHNAETNSTLSFLDMVVNLGSGVIVVPLISLLEDVAVCKAFGDGSRIDVTQELYAIGISNVACSFVQSFPGSGSLPRSAVNNASGVRTPLGGLYTGLVIIISLLFFTPYFFYIPKACLAAIIIAAIVFVVDYEIVANMWRIKKSDLVPAFSCFVACLVFPLQIGILLGIGVNLLFLLYHAARPKIATEKRTLNGFSYVQLTPDRSLSFPAVDYVRNVITKCATRNETEIHVLNCTHVQHVDYTGATTLARLIKDLTKKNRRLIFTNVTADVAEILSGVAKDEFVVCHDEHELEIELKRKKLN